MKRPVFQPRLPRRHRPRRPLPRLKGLPLNHVLPNALTVLALCSGMTAIRFAMDERWPAAVLAVMAAAVFDMMDGRIARLLNGQTRFGAELDSLSDVVSFGVAPALMLYLWTLNTAGTFGWVAALAFAVCCALRLARFNARLEDVDLPPWAFNYFTGVPAPAGAGLVLLPMLVGIEAGPEIIAHPVVVVPWTLLVAGLMVSTLPTFSFKRMRVPQTAVVPALAGVALVAAALVSQPWWTLAALGLAYMASIVFSVRRFRTLSRAAAMIQGPAVVSAEPEPREPTERTDRPGPPDGPAR